MHAHCPGGKRRARLPNLPAPTFQMLQRKLVLAVVARISHERELSEMISWMHYHQALGVAAYAVVSHHCSTEEHSRFRDALASAVCSPTVIMLEDFRCEAATAKLQTTALRATVRKLLDSHPEFEPEATHVGFIDLDEYLVGSIDALFASSYGELPMWLIPSTVYGSSYRVNRSSGFLPANYILAAARRCPYCKVWDQKALFSHSMHKSACLLSTLVNQSTANVFPGLNGEWVHECLAGTNGSMLAKGLISHSSRRSLKHVPSATLPTGVLHLNHYFTRSEQDWQAKNARGRLDHKQAYSHVYQPLCAGAHLSI